MAYRYQLSDLKKGTLLNIAGSCTNSDDFVDTANEVQRRLLRRGNWYDTEWIVKLCVHDGCVTWPRYVGTVLAARFCDGIISDVKNRWYSIIGGAHALNPYQVGYDLTFEDIGNAPTYNQVWPGDNGKLIRYYVVHDNDVGKTIKIFGKKIGGQPLQEVDANGDYVDGITITSAKPYGTSSVYVSHIDSVVREKTQGMAYLYEYDSTNDVLRDLAAYEPNETNPSYRRSRIQNFCCAPKCTVTTTVSGTDYDVKTASIQALVKLEHFDLENDSDFLLIDNYEAFKFGFQAVKLEEANDDAAAEVKWTKATRELNLQLRDKNPANSTAVRMSVINGCTILNPI